MLLPVREARRADIAAISKIYGHAVLHGTASFEIEPPSEAEMARRFQTLMDGKYPYLVAEFDGAVAGYAYAGPYRARLAYRWTVEDSIYVDPAAYRRGIGRVLLALLWQILFMPRLVANPFSTMRASLRWRSSDEFEDGVANGWQSRLRWWTVDSFFCAL